MNTIQPDSVTMTSSEWRMALAQLCQDSALAHPGEEGAMLRLGHALLSQLPDPHSCLADHLPPMARFEALLAAGAHDSAAFSLVPETGSYIVSRAGEGSCMASVMLPGMAEEMTSEADSPALALVSALAAALASCGTSCGESCVAGHGPVDVDASVEWGAMLRCGEKAADDDWRRPQGAMLH